jgi:two-component system, OmpR family, copper resistance phosphate regulon response regulator CusR
MIETNGQEDGSMKILVAEDEPTLNKIIAKRLKIETYSVDSAFNGKEALEYLNAAEYDLLIVDIMMPEMDGLTLVKTIRQQGSQVPVLFLTALDSTQDKVTGLDSGGDDYLVKPFEFDELLARIRSLLRRSNPQQTASTQLSLADLTLDTRTHTVTRAGRGNRPDPQRILRAGLPAAEPGHRPFPGTDPGACLGFFL